VGSGSLGDVAFRQAENNTTKPADARHTDNRIQQSSHTALAPPTSCPFISPLLIDGELT